MTMTTATTNVTSQMLIPPVKQGLQASLAPFYTMISKTKRGTRVHVYRERVIQGQRRYEGIGIIPEAAYAECKGAISHALRAADHRADVGPGRYGLTEDWGIRLAVVAVACHQYHGSWRIHRAASAVVEASPTECYWWLGMMLRPGDAGRRARHAYRIMSEVVDA